MVVLIWLLRIVRCRKQRVAALTFYPKADVMLVLRSRIVILIWITFK